MTSFVGRALLKRLPEVRGFQKYVVSAFRRTCEVRLKPDTTYKSKRRQASSGSGAAQSAPLEFGTFESPVRSLPMARIEPDDLPDAERVFLAGSLRVAQRIEEWLTNAGVDYAVQVEPLGRSLFFGSVRMGAAFYVNAGQAAYCRQQLIMAGFDGGVVETQE